MTNTNNLERFYITFDRKAVKWHLYHGVHHLGVFDRIEDAVADWEMRDGMGPWTDEAWADVRAELGI